jgi:alcohol dehydrogenase (cytochrome c)
MRKKGFIILAGFVLVLGIGGFAILKGAPNWRKEVVRLKLSGALPDESWPDVIRRAVSAGDPSSSLDGVRLQAAQAKKATAENAEAFERLCSGCHGQGGSGGPVGIALASEAVQSGLGDVDIYKAVTRGRGGMPLITENVQLALMVTAHAHSLGAHEEKKDATVHCAGCDGIHLSAADVAEKFAKAGEWPSYSGDYTGQRFSPIKQINTANVSKLRTRFVYQTRSPVGLEPVPIVLNGVMFLSAPEDHVVALDLETGDPIWDYRRSVPEGVRLCCGRRNRGVTVLGDRVFHGTLDGRLVALDIRTGKEIWNVEVADYREGYSITGAPLAVKDKIIVGVAGGDFGAPGVIDAYDPKTGKREWRFNTIQQSHETWQGDSWKSGGGATWVTGTYDPQLDLVYWGVGNPAQVFNPGSRSGNNLYTSSVVALDAKTGNLRWHYQFVPNDGTDWDATSIPVLVDAEVDRAPRKLMLFANRNCFFYTLDRETGKFLSAKPFCPQNWNDGFTAEGAPIRRPGTVPSPAGPMIQPTIIGGANWMSPSYDAAADIFVVKNYHGSNRVFSEDSADPSGGRVEEGISRSINVTGVRGRTGAVAWEVDQGGENTSGVLGTAGGLMFTGDSHGRLVALETTTGKELWRYRLGGQMSMAPITYLHHGVQEIAVISGGSLFVLGLQ